MMPAKQLMIMRETHRDAGERVDVVGKSCWRYTAMTAHWSAASCLFVKDTFRYHGARLAAVSSWVADARYLEKKPTLLVESFDDREAR